MNKLKNNSTDIAILAAGKGTRMDIDIPKVLVNLNGKPMISYLLNSVETVIKRKPFVVVSVNNQNELKQALASFECRYIIQNEQLGTGHAVKILLESKFRLATNLLILYGDHPLISNNTIEKLIEKHESGNTPITMLTARVPDFDGIYQGFYHDGRIVRNIEGKISKIVEPSDADESIMAIKEINPAIFVFKTDWLKKNIKNIMINEIKKEYYLTQIIEIARQARIEIQSVEGNIDECFGVNTKEQLKTIEKIVDKKHLQ